MKATQPSPAPARAAAMLKKKVSKLHKAPLPADSKSEEKAKNSLPLRLVPGARKAVVSISPNLAVERTASSNSALDRVGRVGAGSNRNMARRLAGRVVLEAKLIFPGDERDKPARAGEVEVGGFGLDLIG